MPITQSAKKALRASKRKAVFNQKRKDDLKKTVKQVRTLLSQNKGADAKKLIDQAYKAIDKAAKKGVIKKNAASRKKSRLHLAINKSIA